MIGHEDHPELAGLIGEGAVVAYFGYGSLVNRNTLRTRFLAIRKAEARGWRRFWLSRTEPPIALLTVRPEEAFTLEGVVVYDHIDNLASVDEREAGYHRRIVPHERLRVEGAPTNDIPVFIYEARRDAPVADDAQCHILQSYLDAVMQGFLDLYGEAGLRRFVEETDGFANVIRDRGEPRYPRPVALKEGEAELFDALLGRRGVRFLDPACTSSG